jgi:hypothetical protein
MLGLMAHGNKPVLPVVKQLAAFKIVSAIVLS